MLSSEVRNVNYWGCEAERRPPPEAPRALPKLWSRFRTTQATMYARSPNPEASPDGQTVALGSTWHLRTEAGPEGYHESLQVLAKPDTLMALLQPEQKHMCW